MAGMFYSLKETAERLGKTEDEVKRLAEQGRLREFRDGSSLLFKIDEVNALIAEGTDAVGIDVDLDLGTEAFELEQVTDQEQPAEAAEEPAEAEPAAADLGTEALELEQVTDQEQPAEVAEEPAEAEPAAADLGAEALELEQVTDQEQPAEPAEEPAEAEPAEMDLGTDIFEFDQIADEEQPTGAEEEEPAAAEEGESVPTLEEPVETEPAAAADESFDEDIFKMDEEQAPALEATDEGDATSELGLAPVGEESTADAPSDEDLFLLDEEQQPAAAPPEGSSEEISLAPESGILASESDITDMDTALTGEGVNVLGESDVDYEVTDDSMAETAGAAGTGSEASLEEIEDDVNLDSFGSGSGLLDLSLQADDTSLGGILDEIYTAEGGEEGQPPADEASFEDLTAEVEHPVAEEELAVPEPVPMMPAPMAAVYAEAAPDTQSNILGGLLFLPMLALLYTAIVTLAAMRNVTPSILASVQGLVWYITGGAIAVAVLVAGASFVVGGEKAPKAARPKKEKKAKAEKPKKEKKAKAEKPKKEKKGLFGKKK